MEAIVLCGIQASGKTSFARQHWSESHVRLSLDMLRTRSREDVVLHACLAVKAPIVIDNTNPTRAQRTRYLDLVRAAGYDSAVLYYFATSVEDALGRNSSRPERSRVPDVAIKGTLRKLEVPTLTEGWDRIVIVQALAGGDFHTQDLPA